MAFDVDRLFNMDFRVCKVSDVLIIIGAVHDHWAVSFFITKDYSFSYVWFLLFCFQL